MELKNFDDIKIFTRFNISLFIGFLLIGVIIVLKFVDNYNASEKIINQFRKNKVNGIITILEDKSRGSYRLGIKTADSTLLIRGVQIAWEVEKYNIAIGDSVSKKENDSIVKFYKCIDGVYKENFEYTIY